MTSRRFLLEAIAFSLAACAVVAAINWRINFYALFRDVHGQERSAINNERFAKYLYSYSYVPENFDGLISGSSLADNLDPSEIHGYRVYNLSLSGATIHESTIVVENALAHGHFKLVLICLQPSDLIHEGTRAGGLVVRDYWSAFGSSQLFEDYAIELLRRARHRAPSYTAQGRIDYSVSGELASIGADEALAKDPGGALLGRWLFAARPDALQRLAELVSAIRAHGARVAAFYPAVYEPRYRILQAEYEGYRARVEPLFRPGEVFDFNDGTHGEITRDPAKFADGRHLTNAAAVEASKVLDGFLQRPSAAQRP